MVIEYIKSQNILFRYLNQGSSTNLEDTNPTYKGIFKSSIFYSFQRFLSQSDSKHFKSKGHYASGRVKSRRHYSSGRILIQGDLSSMFLKSRRTLTIWKIFFPEDSTHLEDFQVVRILKLKNFKLRRLLGIFMSRKSYSYRRFISQGGHTYLKDFYVK